MFPKVGLRVMAVWKRTVKGPTLADIKADDEKVPLFANRVAALIRQVLGEHLQHGDFAVVTTPRRRHKERNFACMVAEQIAQRLGVPYRPDSLTRSFKRALARHGLPQMRYHDLRHSTASILVDKGWDINDIKEWLGHADISTTANIYAHISHRRKVSLAQDLDKVLTLN